MENDETFVYKCPNCGGKVDYNEDNHKWICKYCGNTYDALFVPKESITLSNMNDVKYTYYCYLCDNCHSKFLSKNKENAICNKCNNQCLKEGKKTTISKVLDLDYTVSQANKTYYNVVKKFKNRIDIEYLNQDLKLEYINCDLYNGCIKITNENNSKKYIFMNLLIPNIEYDDYRFMYEVGNMGIRNSREYAKGQKENIEARIQEKIRYFTNVDDINYVDSIINACLLDFKNSYGISDLQNVKIDNNLSVSDGVYIPIYRKTINKENQYVFGNHSAMKPYIVQFPEEKNNRIKIKIYNALTQICRFLMIISIMGLFGSIYMYHNLIYLFMIVLVLSIIFNSIFDKKYNYYVKTIKLTKNEYFEQIINNSNYVKGIKVKK